MQNIALPSSSAWEMFIEKHNDEEEAQDLEQRRRAAVVAQPSERRSRRQDNEASRVELRGVTRMPSSDAAATFPHPAAPRGADADLSGAHAPGSASTLGMFSPAVLESPIPLRPRSTPTRRVLQRAAAAIRADMCRRHP